MNNATQIENLFNTPRPAAFTTHALSQLGNGNMQNGIKRIVNYLASEAQSNLHKGRLQGSLIGIAGTIAVGSGIYIIYQVTQKKHNKEGTEILNTLKVSEEITEEKPVDTYSDRPEIANAIPIKQNFSTIYPNEITL